MVAEYHSNTRFRHSANHIMLPDSHLHVTVLFCKTCNDIDLFQDVREVFGRL